MRSAANSVRMYIKLKENINDMMKKTFYPWPTQLPQKIEMYNESITFDPGLKEVVGKLTLSPQKANCGHKYVSVNIFVLKNLCYSRSAQSPKSNVPAP